LADAPGWQVRRLFMRTLLLFLAAAGMAGCASYQTADYDRGAVSAYAQRPAPFIYDRAGIHTATTPPHSSIPPPSRAPSQEDHTASTPALLRANGRRLVKAARAARLQTRSGRRTPTTSDGVSKRCLQSAGPALFYTPVVPIGAPQQLASRY
jgi:hypothetical protein